MALNINPISKTTWQSFNVLQIEIYFWSQFLSRALFFASWRRRGKIFAWSIFGTKYLRMDQVKFVEDSL